MDKLLTVKQLSEMLNVSDSAIYKWIDEKRIPYIDLGAEGKRRCIRFRATDIEREISQKASVQS